MAKKHARGDGRSRRIKYDTIHPAIRLIQLPVMAIMLTLAVEFLNRGMDANRLLAFVTGRPVLLEI